MALFTLRFAHRSWFFCPRFSLFFNQSPVLCVAFRQVLIREGPKKRFIWEILLADSQTRSKPLTPPPKKKKKIKITPKISFFDPNFAFCVPNSYKNPGVGGLVHKFGKTFPNKIFFTFPKLCASVEHQKYENTAFL